MPSTDAVGFLDTSDPSHNLSGSTVADLQRYATSGTHNDSVSDYLERYRSAQTSNLKEKFTLDVAGVLNQPQAKRKLQGSLGLGGTFHCKMVWNSDPMLRGLGILAYLPPGLQSYVDSSSISGVKENAMFLSGCPHVYVNLALDSSVELSVPYVGETVFMPAKAQYGPQIGTFFYYPLVQPTGPAGVVDVITHVYFKMSNVTTFGNYAAEPQYQMDAAIEAVKKSKIVSTGTGKIASWLNKNEDDSTLGDVSRTAGWLFGGASKIADYLGWSKPGNIVNPTPVIHMNTIDMMTSDSTFTGLKYAQNIDAGISRLSLSDNGKDQMMISNFMRENEIIPYEFTFPKTAAIGTVLQTLKLAPALWNVMIDDTPAPRYHFNHMSFLTNMFTYWRGAIDITLHPVMTKFHSGRLRIVYSPQEVEPAVLLDNMSYTYSWIVDLSDPSTWTIRVPYVATVPWKHQADDDGVLVFFAETELHSSAGVSSDVDIFLSVSPTPEFEVAVPDSLSTSNYLYLPDIMYDPATTREPQYQMDTIKFVDSASPSTGAHQLAIGDPVRSIRALLKRFWPSHNLPAGNIDSLRATCVAVQKAKYPPPRPQDRDSDMIQMFAFNYAFSRGGMRFATNGYGTKSVQFHIGVGNTVFNGIDPQQYERPNACDQTVQFGLDEALKFELPWYAERLVNNHFKENLEKRTSSSAIIHFTNNALPIVISRAAADDFDMGFLVGAPPLRRFTRPSPAVSKTVTIPPPTK